MKTTREPMAHRLPPARRRQFLKLCGAVLAAPAVPSALRFAMNEQLFGEAHAFEVESSLPTYFIEMNLRDQWDFGHVFVPPGIATNLANLTRGGSGDALSLFYTADQITAHEGNFYLTPDSQVLIPHLSNIAVLETNPLCEGAIHGHESANPLRSPGRTKSQDPGKQPMWMAEPGYEEQGNDYWYSSTPTPATLHNYWQKQLTPEIANGITMKFISRFHTISHFAAGLPAAELTRIQSVQMLFDTFPTTVEQLALASADEAAVFAAALRRADTGFFRRHGYDEVARARPTRPTSPRPRASGTTCLQGRRPAVFARGDRVLAGGRAGPGRRQQEGQHLGAGRLGLQAAVERGHAHGRDGVRLSRRARHPRGVGHVRPWQRSRRCRWRA
ncbi:MAG: hypothetical protein U0168_20705 [Nannocystaceae bacterium]